MSHQRLPCEGLLGRTGNGHLVGHYPAAVRRLVRGVPERLLCDFSTLGFDLSGVTSDADCWEVGWRAMKRR